MDKGMRSYLLILNIIFSLIWLEPVLAQSAAGIRHHGIAMHGTPKYGPDFTHFDYVNPDAPKGGKLVQSAIGTFDSFNPFIIKGVAADGVELIYDTLTTRALDEPFSEYGLLAREIEMPEDRSSVTFHLRPEARFHDGHPVRAEDVIFTFKLLREQGRPFYRAYYAGISAIEAPDPLTVRFTFGETENRELPLIVGQVPILPKHYWEERNFQAGSLDKPLGSGPYRIGAFEAGRSVTYERVKDYWGADLPVNRGRHNFDLHVYDYYRDGTVALEAFKAGEYDLRVENSSKHWATAYEGPQFEQGLVVREVIQHQNPTGMQAFVYNIRRPQFQDPVIREALAYAFDFEWTNRNIFYNAYTRTHSYFSNSEMAADQLPSPEELKLLQPLRDQVPEEVFTTVYRAPSTNGDGNIRSNLRTALRLLRQAGWEIRNQQLINSQTNQPLRFEVLLYDPAFERVVNPFLRNLERMGVQAHIRLVDVSQYINRLREFDFDMIVATFPQSTSPGNEQRNFWHSDAADRPDSRNLIGIKNPAVDQLVETLIAAPDREALVQRTRALDRVLQWNHYVIPQYHINAYRVAYWNKLGRPATTPKYDLGLDTWWLDPAKKTALDRARER